MRLRVLGLSIFISVCAEAQNPAAGRPLAPFSKDEIVALCATSVCRDHPDRVLTDAIQKNKIAFLPTKRNVDDLLHSGVPKSITDQLKFNFASRIMYRVCLYDGQIQESKRFAEELSSELAHARYSLNPRDLLYDKSFDPVLCQVDGPTKEDLDQVPHVGYVVLMGHIRNASASRKITTRLVFMASGQARSSIGTDREDLVDVSSFGEIAKQVALWSIQQLEDELR